ncbi:peptidyl-prolyl cis-trans isomerase [Parahaliea aestuarii]|uniref:Peptidyl-prolyl cis-trans isomerase n=1 Tax=Parahaliea aestuarii TaxID=1852021 RepID=A0A5C8ZY16_9GAMM|nr:peptidyl-prolyl cis-trans isomerase [Parahaliea aestuarii]TXS93358.1 peptidyl-prolyl cis-trans isomerase [Parahaliea aestuarii]
MSLPTWLRQPWLHFVVIGLVLFFLQSWAFPEPKPVVGPLSEARIDNLHQQWLAVAGQPPSEEQLQSMITQELDRDMLFQRALSLELHLYDQVVYQRLLRNLDFLGMGQDLSDQERYQQALDMRLHLGDEVIKRRMIQVMEQLLLAARPPAEVIEADIAAEFAARQDELRRPPRYSIEQLYFSREREDEVVDVVERIQRENLSAAEARQLSSPFLPGYVFRAQTPDQLARNFGAAFVMNFQEAAPQPGQWVGPLRSTYGLHYVWVESIEPARDATLDEVRPQLERDLYSRRRAEALAAAIDDLREQFEVRRS